MEEDITPDIIKATQTSLGKYVKRPPLSDKLLKKPPFRFLHDIITSVLKNTGFFNGLFEEEELISENVKDRDSKILFLNKVITVVGAATGKPITSIKPSKIVAGQEPQKTNELLQLIALALDNKYSSEEAVKSYKQSMNPTVTKEKKSKNSTTKPVKKVIETNKLTSKSSEKLTKPEKNATNNIKTKLKENTIIKKDSPPKKSSQPSKSINKKGPEKEKQNIKSNTSIQKRTTPKDTDAIKKSTGNDFIPHNSELNHEVDVNSPSTHTTDIVHDDKQETFVENADSSTANLNEEQLTIKEQSVPSPDNNEQKIININENREILSLTTQKESTFIENDSNNIGEKANDLQELHSRPVDDNNYEPNEEQNIVSHDPEILNTEPKNIAVKEKRPQSVRPSSSRPSAPRLKERNESIVAITENLVVGKVNIIAENTTHEEEEDTSIIIVNDEKDTKTESKDQDDILSSNKHGHLVQQILDAQKEFSEATGKTNIEWQFGAQKAKDVLNQEVEQIRFNVQALSRVANPLGKLLDHVQEDVEIMRQELQQWTASYEEASKKLLKQQAVNEESLLPLRAKIKQLQLDITEKHEKINDLKIGIHKNATRIQRLLTNGDVQLM